MNIFHEEAQRVMGKILDSKEERSPPTYFLLELLDIILEHNYFRLVRTFSINIRE